MLSDSDRASIQKIVEIHERIAAAMPGESSSADIPVAWCKRLLDEYDELAAKVERLTPDAKLGAAVRGMPSLAGMNRELVTLVYSSGDNRWFMVTRPGFVWHQMAVVSDELNRTPDAALADAGLMEDGDD